MRRDGISSGFRDRNLRRQRRGIRQAVPLLLRSVTAGLHPRPADPSFQCSRVGRSDLEFLFSTGVAIFGMSLSGSVRNGLWVGLWREEDGVSGKPGRGVHVRDDGPLEIVGRDMVDLEGSLYQCRGQIGGLGVDRMDGADLMGKDGDIKLDQAGDLVEDF